MDKIKLIFSEMIEIYYDFASGMPEGHEVGVTQYEQSECWGPGEGRRHRSA